MRRHAIFEGAVDCVASRGRRSSALGKDLNALFFSFWLNVHLDHGDVCSTIGTRAGYLSGSRVPSAHRG